MWSYADWVQFREYDGTNNLSEGYHSALHSRIRQGNNPLFILMRNLHNEASSIDRSIEKLNNYIPKRTKLKHKVFQECLDLLWDKLANRQISPTVFLQVITKYKIIKQNKYFATYLSRIDLLSDDVL